MAAWFIKLSGIVIPLLFAAALQLGGFKNMYIAIALIVFACLWGLGLLIIWIRRISKATKGGYMVGPGINVESIVESNYRKAGCVIGLKVLKLAGECKSCSGQLMMVDFATPQENVTLSGRPTGHRLRWQDDPSGVRDIDTEAVLEIVYWGQLTSRPTIMSAAYISYVGDEDFRQSHGVHTEWGEILLVVSVTCMSMMPKYVVCILDKEYSGFSYELQLVAKKLDKRPTMDECRQLLKSHRAGAKSQ